MSSTDTAETMERILTIALNPAIDVSCDAEHVRPTLKTRTVNQKHFAGGGGANVARVIAELGGRAELVYLSGGTTGELYDGLLAQYDIGRHRVPIEGDNRIALMVHELSTNFEYRFVPEGPTVDPKEIEPVHDFIETFEGDYIIASGSLPHGAPADTYRRMAAVAQKKGIRFVLDTSGEALRLLIEIFERILQRDETPAEAGGVDGIAGLGKLHLRQGRQVAAVHPGDARDGSGDAAARAEMEVLQRVDQREDRRAGSGLPRRFALGLGTGTHAGEAEIDGDHFAARAGCRHRGPPSCKNQGLSCR